MEHWEIYGSRTRLARMVVARKPRKLKSCEDPSGGREREEQKLKKRDQEGRSLRRKIPRQSCSAPTR